MARNKVADWHRRRNQLLPTSLEQVLPFVEQNFTESDEPEAMVLKREEYALLKLQLSQLSEMQQEVLRLRFIMGMRHAEIGVLLGKNEGAIQGIFWRAIHSLRSLYQQEAQQWGDAHKYHDTYDGKDYYLNSSYLSMDGRNGIQYGESSSMKDEVNAGSSQASQNIKDDYFLLSMLETNYEDTTPYNQPHQVDQSLLNYFNFQHTRALIVSLTEQAVRIYNNGQLEQAFQVTTGREYRPTPIGHFQLTQHFHHITLTLIDPVGSPDYYAPVVVNNAIQFWDNGYLIHSSQWRKDYGAFTQFPHRDSGGDADANVGSHGCINVAPDILIKLDSTITNQTPLIIF